MIEKALRQRYGEDLRSIFTTKEVGKDIGMGLAIVHGIINTYCGFVTCESTLEKCTLLNVYFPTIELEPPRFIKSVETIQSGKERIDRKT